MPKRLEQILEVEEVEHISQINQEDKDWIPILTDDIHDKIRKFVLSSQDTLNRAKELLECAKLAVEMAIEKDEATAISWLEGKISELTGEVAHE